MVPWELVGYRVVAEKVLVVELDKAITFLSEKRLGGLLPPTINLGSGQGVLGRLKTTSVSTWPPTARPPVRVGHSPWLFVDLFAATLRLQPALERPDVSGSLVNTWATHFELGVQASIDDTAWRPSPALAALRGRQLRRGESTLTDIDALGERDGVLLAVSCKALAYGDEWDRGEYKTVRNVASSVADSVHDWKRKIAALRVSPGDNFDFTNCSQIIGVVVYPHVPWSPGGFPLHEIKPGLRAASTAEELSRWCRGESRPRKR
jgi:hypothetical protein